MTSDGAPAATGDFEAERPRLVGLAYRMLGSIADAEDAVQDAWLRWDGLGAAGRGKITSPAAWLTTVTTRLALDRLKSAARAREQYVGPWLPEPVLREPDPAESVELAESLTLGFLTVLERLGPVERAVFVLVDVFGEPYERVALAVGRSEAACRQIAHRARGRLRAERRRFTDDPAHARELVDAFLAAALAGDVEQLRAVLSADVVLVSDGGPHAHAARRPVVGFHRVSRLVMNLARRIPAGAAVDLRVVNGDTGAVIWLGATPVVVLVFETDATCVQSIRVMVNPDKLTRLTTPPAMH